LKNVVERAAILCDGRQIDVDNIIFSHEMGRTAKPVVPQSIPSPSGAASLKEAVAHYESMVIKDALSASKSIRQAAKKLNLSHTALLNKLKKYEIAMVTNRTVGN
jgi:transcriptional regulator of aroF, aroG, tyrA and aromatic amino acid transport